MCLANRVNDSLSSRQENNTPGLFIQMNIQVLTPMVPLDSVAGYEPYSRLNDTVNLL